MRSSYLSTFDGDRVPADAAARWSATEVRHVQSSEAFVYGVAVAGQPAFLRLTHPGHRSAEQVEAELRFVADLATRGVPVARPIPSVGGSLIESVRDGGTTYSACLFAAAPGDRLALRSAADDGPALGQWGRLLGLIHAASAARSPAGTRRFRWSEDDVWTAAEAHLPAAETAARRELAAVRDWLSQLAGDRKGDTHNLLGTEKGALIICCGDIAQIRSFPANR